MSRGWKGSAPLKEYDIYLPLKYYDGTPVEPRKFRNLQFGGVTYFPQPNEGLWRLGNVTYRDEIVIYRVLTAKVTVGMVWPLRRWVLSPQKVSLHSEVNTGSRTLVC